MKNNLLSAVVLLAATSFTTGCAWVKPTADASTVALVKAQAVADCKQLGITTSTTLNKIVFVKRSEEKKTKELITLAKNQAAVMGGDTIVAEGALDGGEQKFAIYRCQ